MIRRAGLASVVLLVGCLDDWGLEDRLFPCREPGDCIDGFVCEPERFVCVPADEADLDAGTADAQPAEGDDAGPDDAGVADAGEADVGP